MKKKHKKIIQKEKKILTKNSMNLCHTKIHRMQINIGIK